MGVNNSVHSCISYSANLFLVFVNLYHNVTISSDVTVSCILNIISHNVTISHSVTLLYLRLSLYQIAKSYSVTLFLDDIFVNDI